MLYLIEKFKDITGLGPFSRRLKVWAVEQPRRSKRWIIMGFDLVCLLLVMVGLTYMRMFATTGFEFPTIHTISLLIALPCISVASFRLFGL